jgi:hypothetical protein
MRGRKAKLLGIASLALGSIGGMSGAVVIGAIPASAGTLNCHSIGVYPPSETAYGISALTGCGTGSPTLALTKTCQEIDSIYGWVVNANGTHGSGTACDNNDTSTYQEAFGNCASGTWSYRTHAVWGGVDYYAPNTSGTSFSC